MPDPLDNEPSLCPVAPGTDPLWCCTQLEAGRILHLPEMPFSLSDDDRQFLMAQQQSGSSLHKNISYRPREDVLRGLAKNHASDTQRLHGIMRAFSGAATEAVGSLLAPYAPRLRLDFASFRGIEEAGRDLPLHKRNDLLHVDSFPTRPTRGARILRMFINVSFTQDRVWLTGPDFSTVAEQFADVAGLSSLAAGSRWAMVRGWHAAKRRLGLISPRHSPYDRFMLRFHDYLKENDEFQSAWPHERLVFPPGASWMVFTDAVPHAVLSGRGALEQTFIVAEESLVDAERSPRRILERLCRRPLVHAAA